METFKITTMKVILFICLIAMTSCMGAQGDVPLREMTSTGWINFIIILAIIIGLLGGHLIDKINEGKKDS